MLAFSSLSTSSGGITLLPIDDTTIEIGKNAATTAPNRNSPRAPRAYEHRVVAIKETQPVRSLYDSGIIKPALQAEHLKGLSNLISAHARRVEHCGQFTPERRGTSPSLSLTTGVITRRYLPRLPFLLYQVYWEGGAAESKSDNVTLAFQPPVSATPPVSTRPRPMRSSADPGGDAIFHSPLQLQIVDFGLKIAVSSAVTDAASSSDTAQCNANVIYMIGQASDSSPTSREPPIL